MNTTYSKEIEKEIEEVANADGSSMELSDKAFQYLYEKHQIDMPYGTQKARTGCPYEWLDENVLPDYDTRTDWEKHLEQNPSINDPAQTSLNSYEKQKRNFLKDH